MTKRYVRPGASWMHRIVSDLRTYLIIITALSLYAVIVGTNASSTSQKSVDTLVNCTTPHHKCYDRSQAATGVAIATIQRANIYANYCAVHFAQTRKPVTVPAIERCVADLLAKAPNG